MANLAQTVNVLQAVILTKDEKMILTPTYHVMKMYNVHQDAKLMPVSFDSPTYDFENEELNAISISASIDNNGMKHFSLVNIDLQNEHKIELDVADLDMKDATALILTSEKLQDYNSFESPEKIKPTEFKDFKLRKGKLTVSLPPFSVVVIESK
jgi:alpha-N-arabinofuranosidase